MSDFTDLDPTAKLPCPYIYGAAILGKLHEFLCSSLQLNNLETHQSTIRCACGYKEASSLLSTVFPLD